jgi:hypothetical protein
VVSQQILPRLALLLVIGVAADLWCTRHFGVGVSNPGGLSAIVVAFTAVAGLLDHLVEKEEKEQWAAGVRSFLRQVLALPVVVILALLLAIFAFSYSSVMVVSAAGETPKGVKLVPLGGGGRPFSSGDPRRLVAYTGPFGERFRLEVPGYLPKVVTVPVLTGLHVVPESDLQRIPTLLLRPPGSVLKLMAVPGASLHLSVRKDGAWRPFGPDPAFVCQRLPCPAGSYLVGRPQPVPPEILVQWRMELQVNGPEEEEIARTILAWKNPQHLKDVPPVIPEMEIQVEVRSRADQPLASAHFVVGKEDFQDIAMSIAMSKE